MKIGMETTRLEGSDLLEHVCIYGGEGVSGGGGREDFILQHWSKTGTRINEPGDTCSCHVIEEERRRRGAKWLIYHFKIRGETISRRREGEKWLIYHFKIRGETISRRGEGAKWLIYHFKIRGETISRRGEGAKWLIYHFKIT